MLNGSIPVKLCKCVQLTTLNLGRNELAGGIPPKIGELVNLDYLVLAQNKMTGEMPMELQKVFQVWKEMGCCLGEWDGLTSLHS